MSRKKTNFGLGFSYNPLFGGIGFDLNYSTESNETSSRDPPAQQPAITGNQPIAIEGASSRSNQSNAIEGASSRSNNSRSRTIAFYRNEIPAGQNGAHIETILQEWSEDYNKLDEFNNYIQCLFPNRNPGQNSEAPLLTDEDVEEICSSPTLKERARRAFIMMLNFYGMELEGSCTITLASNHRQRLQQIISQDKYYLVITRILWFLKEINERQLMMVWLKFLADLIKEEKLDIDAKQSYSQYWINTLDHSDKNEIKEYIQQINRN